MNNKRIRVLVTLLAALAIGSILFAACTRPGTPGSSTASGATSTPSSSAGGGTGSNGCPNGTAHMVATNFAQPCVNISKGSMLTVVDDGSFFHILANGSWVNGTAQPANEPGAPTVGNVQISGGSKQIGPFNTAGTYHIYCSVHQNMNLLIHVS
jgi:plastocyanin